MWIAWNSKQTQIIASGKTLAEAHKGALAAGDQDPLLEKVPRADVHFAGSRR
jgi:hypothetical protein